MEYLGNVPTHRHHDRIIFTRPFDLIEPNILLCNREPSKNPFIMTNCCHLLIYIFFSASRYQIIICLVRYPFQYNRNVPLIVHKCLQCHSKTFLTISFTYVQLHRCKSISIWSIDFNLTTTKKKRKNQFSQPAGPIMCFLLFYSVHVCG